MKSQNGFVCVLSALSWLIPVYHTFPHNDIRDDSSSELVPRAPTPRKVSVILDMYGAPSGNAGGTTPEGQALDYSKLDIHAEVQFHGTPTDGIMRIGVVYTPDFGGVEGHGTINVKDFGVEKLGQQINLRPNGDSIDDPIRIVYDVGQTGLTNAELINLDNGKGIIQRAYAIQPGYKSGSNGCVAYAERLVKSIGLAIPPDYVNIQQQGQIAMTAKNVDLKLMMIRYKKLALKTGGEDRLHHMYDLENPAEPARDPMYMKDGKTYLEGQDEPLPDSDDEAGNCPAKLVRRAGACSRSKLVSDDQVFIDEKLNRADLAPISQYDELPADGSPWVDNPADPSKIRGIKEYTVAKTFGQGTRFIPSAGDRLSAAVPEAWRVGARATVVLVELVAKQAAGIAFRLAASLVFGPIGAIITTVIGAIVDLVLGIVHGTDLGADTDPVGILRRQFFGSAKKTGTEKCAAAGHDNCTLLMGASTLSGAFHLSNKEVIALLIHFNEGYPMTIDDLATALKPGIGTDATPPSPDAPFWVQCHSTEVSTGREGVEMIPGNCNRPEWGVHADKLIIPPHNTPASQIFPTLIAPNNTNGDCKLVNDAASTKTYTLPDGSNLTTHGEPVAIQCGLAGRGIQIETDPNAITETSDSNATADAGTPNSSDSLEHSPAAPPKAIFADMKAAGALCLTGKTPENTVCFSSGSYHAWQGTQFTGFEFGDISALTIPTGGKLTYAYTQGGTGAGPGGAASARGAIKELTASGTISKNDHDLIQLLRAKRGTFNVTVPAKIPSACLHFEENLGGATVCFGVGGWDLDPNLYAKKAKGISVHDGATAYIYAGTYGDQTGAVVQGDIPDLKQEVFGDANWSGQIAAMAVIAPSVPAADPAVVAAGNAPPAGAASAQPQPSIPPAGTDQLYR